MAVVEVYGASDDLIEVDGDICEEFNPIGDTSNYLAFSDGTLLSVTYDQDGIWRISALYKGSAQLELKQSVDVDDDNYSDRATLIGDVEWVVYAIAKAGLRVLP